MKKVLCCVLLAAFAISCGGGGGGGPTAPSGSLVGNFTLQEINGTVDGQRVRLTPPAVTGNMSFTADGRFSANFSAPQLGEHHSWTGSCTVDGTTLILHYDGGGDEVWTLSPDGNQISGTYTEDGVTVNPIFTRDPAQVVLSPRPASPAASSGDISTMKQALLEKVRLSD